jgi:hypothetical protein
MQEILPGLYHWTAFRDTIRAQVSSYYVERAGILVDPLLPDDGGMEALERLPVRPQQVVLSNRLHRRHAPQIAEHFDIPIRVPMPGMHAFAGEPRARPYEFSDEVAPGVFGLKVDKLSDDEAALHITVTEPGSLAFGDTLTRYGGALGFVPDDLMGHDPQRVKEGLRQKFRGLLARDFDALLFAHGDPLTHDGKEALRRFVEQPVGYPEYGNVI